MVTHNLCIDLGDHPMDVDDTGGMLEEQNRLENRLGYGGIEVDGHVQLPEGETGEELREQGRNKREAVLNELFPLADYA
jgi:hypothetical protein